MREADSEIYIIHPCDVEIDTHRFHSFLHVQTLHMWWFDYNLYFKYLGIIGRH